MGHKCEIIVNIDVPELAPAIDFYTAALDLRLGRILDDDVAELTGASCEIYLLANHAGTKAASIHQALDAGAY